MLKSHFNINRNEDEEEEAVDEQEQPRKKESKPRQKQEKKRQQEQETTETIEPEYEAEEQPQQEFKTVEEFKILSPRKELRRSDVSTRLSLLGKTADGDGYTYLKATITGMGLTSIKAITFFQHLQFVDLSQNKLKLDNLQVVTELPYLVLIQADHNLLNSAALNKTKYLQVMILNNNQLTSVEDVFQPELSTLEVGYNQISTIFFRNRMPNIRCLDFRYNLIDFFSELNFPLLDSLYLAGNKIKSLQGIKNLVNLRILHVRNNPIKLLDGFDPSLTKLQYINLRNCKVATLRQVKKLRDLPALDTLVMKGCPYMGGTGEEDAEVAQEEEDPELRVEVITIMPRLKRLNKTMVSPEERTEADDLRKQWLEEGEKEDEEEIEEELAEEESNPDL